MSHSNVDEAVATEAVDVATLVAENASLRDRLLRALADAENTRRRAERAAEEARKYAIADFARELLAVADNLQRTIAAASRHSPETVEDQALIEGVRATERLLEHTFSRFGIQKIDALGKPLRSDPARGGDGGGRSFAAARHGRARSGGRLHDPRSAPATSPRPSRQAPERSIFLADGRRLRPNSTLVEPSIRRERSRAMK